MDGKSNPRVKFSYVGGPCAHFYPRNRLKYPRSGQTYPQERAEVQRGGTNIPTFLLVEVVEIRTSVTARSSNFGSIDISEGTLGYSFAVEVVVYNYMIDLPQRSSGTRQRARSQMLILYSVR
jgi:hypothetical protein